MFAFRRDTPFSLDDKTRSVPPLRGTPRIAPGPKLPAQQPQEGVEAEIKRRLAGASQGEP
jgi:hypothetical protein